MLSVSNDQGFQFPFESKLSNARTPKQTIEAEEKKKQIMMRSVGEKSFERLIKCCDYRLFIKSSKWKSRITC